VRWVDGTLLRVSEAEVRSAPRFKIHLHVQIAGLDSAPVARSGDISASGLFIEVDRAVGSVGSIERLMLGASEEGPRVVVLARIVRVTSMEDLWQGRIVTGVAFQFLFAEEMAPAGAASFGAPGRRNVPIGEAKSIQALLRKVVQRDAEGDGLEVSAWRGRVHTSSGEQSAAVQGVNVRGMAVETDYSVQKGEVIRVEMPGNGRDARLSFDGEVIECSPIRPKHGSPTRYRVTVRFGTKPEPLSPSAAGDTLDEAFEALIEAFTSMGGEGDGARPAQHLAGQLARISLFSVLTLCQLERVTGLLRLGNGTSTVHAFLDAGELVDATIVGRDVPPRRALDEVMGWKEGSFEVLFEAVGRPNRIGMPMTALLIDLARDLDERGA
jgi:hypothetical protein